MKGQPHLFLKFSLTALLLAGPLVTVAYASMARAQFSPPPMGAPGNREAGSARSDTCAATTSNTGLMALIPTTNLGLTTKADPTFFAYVPPNNAQRTEFRLIDEATSKELFVGQIQLPGADPVNASYKHKASVVSFTLPSNTPKLEAGKNYLWALMLVCDPKNRAGDVVVTGVIQKADQAYVQKLPPTVQQKLTKVGMAPPQEQVSIYGSAGIWHDMLAEAAVQVQGTPTAGSQWSSVLSSQGMGSIATAPLFKSSVTPLQP